MNRNEFENYLESLSFIKTKKIELESNKKNIYIIDEISNFIIKNKEYSNIKSFLKLSDKLVEFIESYNGGIINNSNIEDYFTVLKVSLCEFEEELNKKYQINIYFYGDDSYGIINNNLNRFPIKKIVNEKHLKTICLKNKGKSQYNILFLTKEMPFRSKFFDEILNYNQIALAMKNAVTILYKNNYDYNFLKYSLNKAMNDNSIETIIVGNSYPLVGIDKELFPQNAVNLSMSSQDLYYSFELAKKSISSNKNVSKCILGISYYLLRHDLSKGESEYSENMIKNLYYPILNDYHNFKEVDFEEVETLNSFNIDNVISVIFDLEKIEQYFMSKLYDTHILYYNNKTNPRKSPFTWSSLNNEQKETIGVNRAHQHNKLFKYENTRNEYLLILDDFINFAQNNNIELVCVVFPTTKYYNENIKKEFKQEFEEIVIKLKNNDIKVIDIRLEENNFNDMDYADSDHLNDLGATKATNYILKELLYK